ncbi:hypothetical protein EDC55_1401 [Allofrancisella inopinata]|uniref:Uncharacterized protein n=1 Tax=Allofrancisella inopinata TaxID=1085647 RepID=A0AAE6YIE3_9GAMM|nr:hypothetical protein [Allofrancisella inopinata]QIV95337.1 hypothetical protein E4K63_00175 [Allofrancisella inopinata]TDT65064.1 hypothetical protein EDC55_1401 [Allofrancisella inopinata]
MLNEKYTIAEIIAIKLSRNKSAIYRCISNNVGKRGYSANVAYKLIKSRRLNSSKTRRILPNSILEKYIFEKVKEYWSPEQVANMWKTEAKETLCHETIYQYIYI